MKRLSLFAAMIAVVCSFTILSSALAQTTKVLEVGDQVPQLKYGKWIKGKPVSSLSGDQVYVLEFWATWCGPCKSAMPHLTKLQQQYKGKVTFIGVNVWERVAVGKPYESSLPYVEKYVIGNETSMGYAAIADNNEQFMANNWLMSSGQVGIPATFVVKENKLLWIGHPIKLDSILPQILNGSFDVGAARAAHIKIGEKGRVMAAMLRERDDKIKPVHDAIKAKDYQKALTLIDQMSVSGGGNKSSMNDLRFITYLEMGFKETRDFGDQWLKETPSSRSSILEAVLAKDDLPKETYLWTAGTFGNTDNIDYPVLMDMVATCYARGGDFKKAAALEQRALEDASKMLKEGKLVGYITDFTIKDFSEKLKKYKNTI